MTRTSGDDRVGGLRCEIDEIARAITHIRQSAGAGAQVQLAGLDLRINELCTMIAAIPRPIGQSLEPIMQNLLGLLDDLRGALGAQQDGTVAEADPARAHQAAANAYRNTPR